ncbi:NUDIX domain-containing protein [Actinacidiphila acididurans]|uniref:NUDIX domain-containing protein n=1 Tax=Actinacidiphila acididurans TaxID=2784346 RepID=A0ABS2TT43_9ACTN|nr:NUDIX domain-containing protein [Actinacidiphila acididurans]MBM9505987.1 NUDIX domain-containing protein [Actinacidiphila acididurans]
MPPDIPSSPATRPVVKRTARAILLDDGGKLILIKRTKPGLAPYWITPGGGVEDDDAGVMAALHREVDEELGAKVTDVVPAFVDTVEHITGDGEHGVKVQYFFACRLESMDLSLRHGPEIDAPDGEYEVVRVPFSRMGIASVDIVPLTLRHYLDANIEGILGLLGPDLD